MLTIYRSSMISILTISILFFLTALTGCSKKAQIPDVSLLNQPDRYSVAEKINLNVGIALNGLYEDLRADKWEKKIANETIRMALGEQLAKNSSELVCLLFNQVSGVTAQDLKDNPPQGLILTPRFVAITSAAPAIRGDELKVMIAMEWKLEDRNKNLVWIDTVKGKANTLADGDFKEEDFNKTLLNDLFSKSFQAVKSSPEIRKYAAKNQNPATKAGIDGTISAGASNYPEKCSKEIIDRFRSKGTGDIKLSEKKD
jgi:hypothetical protein